MPLPDVNEFAGAMQGFKLSRGAEPAYFQFELPAGAQQLSVSVQQLFGPSNVSAALDVGANVMLGHDASLRMAPLDALAPALSTLVHAGESDNQGNATVVRTMLSNPPTSMLLLALDLSVRQAVVLWFGMQCQPQLKCERVLQDSPQPGMYYGVLTQLAAADGGESEFEVTVHAMVSNKAETSPPSDRAVSPPKKSNVSGCLGQPMCSGHGACVTSSTREQHCRCEPGWFGFGCEVRICSAQRTSSRTATARMRRELTAPSRPCLK